MEHTGSQGKVYVLQATLMYTNLQNSTCAFCHNLQSAKLLIYTPFQVLVIKVGYSIYLLKFKSPNEMIALIILLVGEKHRVKTICFVHSYIILLSLIKFDIFHIFKKMHTIYCLSTPMKRQISSWNAGRPIVKVTDLSVKNSRRFQFTGQRL